MAKKGGLGLGKGLGALIDTDNFDLDLNVPTLSDDKDKVVEIDINRIEPNKNQPRTDFNEETLLELAKSIENMGIISPIIVAQKENTDLYEIIAGERRWRAARLAKINTVPAIIKKYSDLERLEVALVENIQREDLNPVEEALTYEKFHEDFHLTQEEIAEKVGKSRAAVTNALRLLKLDKRVLVFLKEKKITSGHSRALLGLENNDIQFETAEKIIEEQLSVRQTEELVKSINENGESTNKPTKSTNETQRIDEAKKAAFKDIEKNLNVILGTKVNIKNGKNKGKIEIEYYSENELERLISLFNRI